MCNIKAKSRLAYHRTWSFATKALSLRVATCTHPIRSFLIHREEENVFDNTEIHSNMNDRLPSSLAPITTHLFASWAGHSFLEMLRGDAASFAFTKATVMLCRSGPWSKNHMHTPKPKPQSEKEIAKNLENESESNTVERESIRDASGVQSHLSTQNKTSVKLRAKEHFKARFKKISLANKKNIFNG